MTLVANQPPTASIENLGTPIRFRDGTGVYPGVIHEGGVGGRCRVIVFGMRRVEKKANGEAVVVDVPSTVVNNVPYSSRVGDDNERKSLFPYWELV